MLTIRLFILFFMMLFAIEDLVGAANVQKLETTWLNTSNRLFSKWYALLKSIGVWWQRLTVTGIVLALSSAMAVAVCVFSVWAMERIATLLGGGFIAHFVVYTPFAFIAAIGSSFALLPGFVAQHWLQQFLLSDSDFPIEVRLASLLVKELDWGKWEKRGFSKKSWGRILFLQYLLCGVLIPGITLVSLVLRLSVYIPAIAIWSVLFLPPKLLHLISRKLGATSFLRVGKYLVMVFGLVLSVVLETK